MRILLFENGIGSVFDLFSRVWFGSSFFFSKGESRYALFSQRSGPVPDFSPQFRSGTSLFYSQWSDPAPDKNPLAGTTLHKPYDFKYWLFLGIFFSIPVYWQRRVSIEFILQYVFMHWQTCSSKEFLRKPPRYIENKALDFFLPYTTNTTRDSIFDSLA